MPIITTILPLSNLPRFQNFSPQQLTENTVNVDSEYHIAESISVAVS